MLEHMKTTIDTPGQKFKEKEKEFRSVLPSKSIVGMRLDGKAFHTFTKQFERPYDLNFMDAMDATAAHLAKAVGGTMFGYVQSDEISIFFTDLFSENEQKQLQNGGKIEKLLSTSASAATGAFLKAMPEVNGIPVFDARLFLLDDLDELNEYVDWRRLDARKNSISMAASTLYSPKQLFGKSTRERHDLLEGTPLEELPGGFFEGRLIVSQQYTEDISYTVPKTKETKYVTAVRSRWVVEQATRERTTEEIAKFRKLEEATK